MSAERCTDCMNGQGRDCTCGEPLDERQIRWVLTVLTTMLAVWAAGLWWWLA